MFRWASISKSLTATAALKLDLENTDFSLNDKMTEHVSSWPSIDDKGKVRIKHLLSNRAGIIHYKNKDKCPENSSPNHSQSIHTSNSYNAEQGVEVFKER